MVLIATSIGIPAAAASPDPSLQGTSLPSAPAATNQIPRVSAAPTLPLQFVDSPSGSNVSVRPNITVPAAPKVTTEVASLRTERSRTYQKPDGSFSLQLSQTRVNFQDAGGNWQPIDTALVATTTGSAFDLTEKANDKKVSLSKTHPDTGLAQLTVGPYTVGIRIPSIGKFTSAASTNATSFSSPAGSYALVPTPDGLEFSGLLADARAPLD